ncbi:MAG: LytTR family DNA-binding domain-containing protein [Gemmatimonadales bacterium]
MVRCRAVVVEDEPLARRRLGELLADAEWLEVVGEAADGTTGLDLLERLTPDVAFLDVAMPGLSGIELVQRLERKPLVVYTTAHAEHAVAAFGVAAIDYLVKPFGRRRMGETLERIRRAIDRRSGSNDGLTELAVRHRGATIPISIDEIVRFEGRDDYVGVYTAGQRYLATIRLAELDERLPNGKFLRIHRSHIVSAARIRAIRPDGTGRAHVTLADGTTLRASRAGAAALRRRFGAG